MGALMMATDWSASPLGEPENWPSSLKTTVGLLLRAEALGARYFNSIYLVSTKSSPKKRRRAASSLGASGPRPKKSGQRWGSCCSRLRTRVRRASATGPVA